MNTLCRTDGGTQFLNLAFCGRCRWVGVGDTVRVTCEGLIETVAVFHYS